MKCADPVLCYTGPTKKLYRHWSMASPIVRQFHQQVFNCGKCLFCRKNKSRELATRCVLHASIYKQNCFITLTYDEKKEGYNNVFHYPDIQKFKKRYRQYVWRTFRRRIEIFNVHEYGSNGKKHWHLIVFNHDFSVEMQGKDPNRRPDRTIHTRKNGIPLYTSHKLSELWPYGFNTVGDVSEASAMYQAQYTQKDFKYNHAGTNKKSHSKHAGIGKPFFLLHYKQILTLGFIPFDGSRLPIPRYFEKIAHRHFCHFYDQSAFAKLPDRKPIHRPFKDPKEANQEIADLYKNYVLHKQEKIKILIEEWDEVISQYVNTQQEPDFVLALDNAKYDLKNKLHTDVF